MYSEDVRLALMLQSLSIRCSAKEHCGGLVNFTAFQGLGWKFFCYVPYLLWNFALRCHRTSEEKRMDQKKTASSSLLQIFLGAASNTWMHWVSATAITRGRITKPFLFLRSSCAGFCGPTLALSWTLLSCTDIVVREGKYTGKHRHTCAEVRNREQHLKFSGIYRAGILNR